MKNNTNWYDETIIIKKEDLTDFLIEMIKDIEKFDKEKDDISYFCLYDALEMQSKKEYNNNHISYETYTKILKKYGGITLW